MFSFIVIRINSLGLSQELYLVLELKINHFFLFIIVVLLIQYYMKILTLIFYPYVIKLHIYLYYYPFYKNVWDFIRTRNAIISDFFDTPYTFFFMTLTYKDFIKIYKRDLKIQQSFDRKGLDGKPEEIRRQRKKYVKIWYILNHFTIVQISIKYLFSFLRLLNTHSSQFLYYLPHSYLLITIIYDIHMGLIYFLSNQCNKKS